MYYWKKISCMYLKNDHINYLGTPLQFLMMNRLKNEGSATRKSISDSIKKHIFHKSLISRTPKRSTNNSLLNLGVSLNKM